MQGTTAKERFRMMQQKIADSKAASGSGKKKSKDTVTHWEKETIESLVMFEELLGNHFNPHTSETMPGTLSNI